MSIIVHLLCDVSISRRFQRYVFSLAGIGPKCAIRNSDTIHPEVKSTVSIIGDLLSGFQKNFSIIYIFQNYDFSLIIIGVALVLLNTRRVGQINKF